MEDEDSSCEDKYCKPLNFDQLKNTHGRSMKKVQKSYPDWYVHKINTDQDHVHLILEFPPKYSISFCVQRIKSLTSADLRKKFKFIDKIYGESGIWGVGYYVSTVGLNEEQIRKYVEKQGQRDVSIDVTAEYS